MTNFAKFQRVATAAVGALLISTVFVGAAVGPAATATTPAPAFAAAQSSLSVQA